MLNFSIRRSSYAAWAWYLLLILCAVLLWMAAIPGPDNVYYRAWDSAFRAADIFLLPGNVASPMGVPVSFWSHGPGLISSVIRLPLDFLSLRAESDLIAGFIATIVLWWALFDIFFAVTKSHFPTALLGLAATFLGTHLGYYSRDYASEIPTYACLAVMVRWVLVRHDQSLMDTLVLGLAAAFLVMIRPYLLPYAAIPIAVALYRIARQQRRVSVTAILHCAAIGVPLLLALGQVLLVNRWMTGAFLSSPYTFGDDQFHSFDFSHPEFFAVLFHPWHGLLIYHPLYALGIAAVVWQIISAPSWHSRLVHSAILVVVSYHLYVHASWFCWWLGTGTFGMRGMGISAILLMPATAALLRQQLDRGLAGWAFITVPLIAACVWSALLFLQGDSNYLTMSSLWSAQLIALSNPLTWVTLLAAALSAEAFIVGSRSPSWRDNTTLGVAGFLCTVTVYCIAEQWITAHLHLLWGDADGLLVAATFAACAAALVAMFVAIGRHHVPRARTLLQLEKAILVGMLAMYVVGLFLFLRLAVATERRIDTAQTLSDRFAFRASFFLPEVQATYDEYLMVPGFDDKKAALRVFIGEATRQARLPPSDGT